MILQLFLSLLIGFVSSQQQPLVEAFKILTGDTLRLECPQMNPTWFYKSFETNIEDLIVTRHGVINVEYKHKITSHPTLKHKIIFINKIGIEDDGLYSCLYTKPVEATIGHDYDDDIMPPSVQERFMFNVTVYTLISGLTMNIKPYTNNNRKIITDSSRDFFELSENVLTVKENDELLVNCLVERSKPAAQIHFQLGDDSPNTKKAASVVTASSSVMRNEDRTYKTVYLVNLKASPIDHGKVITCNAENGLSNQKWENRRVLNVLFAPICKDQENFQYFIGINQTITIECRIKNANPIHVNYDWYFKNRNIIDYSTSRGDSLNNKQNKQNEAVNNEGFINRIKIKPTSIHDFGEIKCQAANDIGSTSCLYELKLGGIPNPPYDCTYTLKNSSAIIFCQLGYHQGDPDIYCYLLRKSDNGVYKEHTRSRDACSFIVNDVPENKLNEFWVYTSNKFGHNKESGVYLTIGQIKTSAVTEGNTSKTLILIGSICGITIFLILACCLCFKIRKGFHDESDSLYDNDLHNGKNAPMVIANHNNEYNEKPTKQKDDFNDEQMFDDNDAKDSEEMLKDRSIIKHIYNNKKPIRYDSDDEKEETRIRKNKPVTTSLGKTNKYETAAFTYDDPKLYVSYFNQQQKPKETVDDIKLLNQQPKKNKFPFLTLNHPNSSRTGGGTLSTNERYPTPLTAKRSTKFTKTKRDVDDDDAVAADDSISSYEKSKTKLLSDLNDKLFSIAAGLTNVDDQLLYSTTTRKPLSQKDISLNTISTGLQSDSSPTAAKLVSFTSTNSNDRPSQIMSTFSSNSNNPNNNIYSTITRRSPTHKQQSPLKRYDSFSNDLYETKFLSNLCEEIELTLNVDCMLYDENESSSSAQCDSNVNSELSTDSSSHNLPNAINTNTNTNTSNKPLTATNNNTKVNNVNNKVVNSKHHHHHHRFHISNRNDLHDNNNDNSNMIVNTSRAPNERINDYNYNQQRTNSQRPPAPPPPPQQPPVTTTTSTANDDFTMRKNNMKNIGVLV